MSTYTRRGDSTHRQYNTAGKRHGNVYTQHGVSGGRRADGVDRPFPNKPVSLRRPLNTRTQDSLDLCDFDKITITKQPRGRLPPREHHSNGIRETPGSWHPRKDSHRLPSGELQMARAIHAKELVLQEKLWRVEEKVRQKIQRAIVDAAAGKDHGRGQAERGNSRSEHEREPQRSREMLIQDRRREDVKELRKKQDQRNEDRAMNRHEEDRASWKRRETEAAQLKRKETHEIIGHKKEVSGGLSKSRWENVKEHSRRKGGAEKDNHIWRETGVKPRDGPEKTSHRAATENRRDAGRKLSLEPLLPLAPIPSHSSRPEQGQRRPTDSTDTNLQLIPCRVCNRKFASERLEKHVQICKKVKQSQRPVFNSYVTRIKGSALEEFWKTHTRSSTPEALKKKNPRQNHKADTRNLHEGRPPARTSQPKRSK